jgi:hypothetical protein
MKDELLLDKIIEDYERLLGIITNRLNELKAMKKGEKVDSEVVKDSIKKKIEEKRKEIMAQVERTKGK